MMKRLFVTVVVVVGVLFALTACTGGSGGTIVNDTGFDIYYLYVSPSSSGSWGEDVLGDSILDDGRRFSSSLAEEEDLYDIRAIDEDGDTYTIFNVNLREGPYTITLSDLD